MKVLTEVDEGQKLYSSSQQGHHLKPSGRHAVADFIGVGFEVLDNSNQLELLVREAVVQAGATLLSVMTHSFSPQGVTVCAMLAESHVTIHTYPEFGVAMIDAFTCGDVDPLRIVETLILELAPSYYRMSVISRGVA